MLGAGKGGRSEKDVLGGLLWGVLGIGEGGMSRTGRGQSLLP